MKQQILVLLTLFCLAAPMHAMNPQYIRDRLKIMESNWIDSLIESNWRDLLNADPEYFQDLVCPEKDEEINREHVLASNPLWKNIAKTADQTEKNAYLKEIEFKRFDWDPAHRRKAIICALAAGAEPDTTNTPSDIAILAEALSMKDEPLVKFALKCGANPNVEGHLCFPLLFSAYSQTIAELLIEHNANIFVRDRWGDTILHHINNPELISFYVQQGCDINAQDEDGFTPIMDAILRHCDTNKLKACLQAGADITIKNKHGKTLLDIAQESNCLTQVQEIIKAP